MRHRAVRISALALAVTTAVGASAFAPPAQAVRSPHAAQSSPGHEATRAALRDLVEKGGLPGVAAMTPDSRGNWYGAAGFADTATGRERSPGDHFRGASITKTFIATVLLQLEAEGRLSMDDSVETWLPGLVRGNGYDGSRITLRRLLNHTSGIANYTAEPEFVHKAAGCGFPEHSDIISIAGDLNRFQRSLIRGDLLPPRQMKEMLDEVPLGDGTGYGLGVEFAQLSCGVKVVGKSGLTNGSLSAMVGTPDGKHQLTFNVNGDWLQDGSLYVNAIEAEFCGKTSLSMKRPSAPLPDSLPDSFATLSWSED